MNYPAPISVSTDSYKAGATQFYWGNHYVVDSISTLSTGLDGGGGMAGGDTGGEAFAAQYDAAAGPLLQAGASLGETMAKLANLLNVSLVNHQGADYGAMLDPYGYESDGDDDPDDWIETISCPDPPSAKGGTGDLPGWWHWIASHVEGLVWPDADTGRMRSVGQAWLTAAGDMDVAAGYPEAAANEIAINKSPEIADAVATCHDVRDQADHLASAYRTIGHACIDYANAVDKAHDDIGDALADFIKWTIIIEGGGIILTEIGGELWSQAIESAKVASAARRVVEILKPVVELAKTFATSLLKLVDVATTALKRFKIVLGARGVRNVAETAEAIAKAEKDALIAELRAAGVKFNPDEIVTIFRDGDGNIVWLEQGNARAGLQHILGEHAADFARKGIPEDQVPSLLQKALEDGRVVGSQGAPPGRPIYLVEFEGREVKVAITVGKNGFIVGANPVS